MVDPVVPTPPAPPEGAPPVQVTAPETLPVPAPPLAFPKTLEHTVSQNETLAIIAEMYDTKVEEIIRANPTVKSDADLKVNMKILVPYH